MNLLARRRTRLLIERTQPFADEELVAAANFTWVDAELAGGLPDWTLIGAGVIGDWLLSSLRLTEQQYSRRIGPIPLGAWRAICFEFPPDRTRCQPNTPPRFF